MNILDSIDTLSSQLTARNRAAFDQILGYLAMAPQDHLAKQLERELDSQAPDTEECLILLDKLEEALSRYHRPLKTQEAAFYKDMKVFFSVMRSFVKMGRMDGARDNMPAYWDIFDPTGKSVCGALRNTCRYADKKAYPERNCQFNFWMERDGEHKDDLVCPKCDAVRMFCLSKPKPNGRCRYHGGKKASHQGNGPLLRGDTIYGKVLGGKMRKFYRQFQEDPDFLSVLPEINLLRSRIATYAEKLDEFDPSIIKKGVEWEVDRLRDALDDGDLSAAYDAVNGVEAYMQQANTGERRWQEIVNNSGLVVRAAEAERRRVVEAKQMITRQESAAIIDSIIREFSQLLNTMARDNYKVLDNAVYRHFPKQYQQLMGKMRDIQLEGKMARSMHQRLSDALNQAREDESLQELREERLALVEGDLEGLGPTGEEFEDEGQGEE